MNLQSVADIKKVWQDKAKQLGKDPHCTLPDYNLRHLEAQYVIRHLRADDYALDIGCGNGTTTVQFAEHVDRIIGGDYAPAMIEHAKQLHVKENVEYKVMDVLQLDAPDATFDVVISERCLINLPNWETQQAAIREIARVLKPGGRLLMSESYEEAFKAFEELRKHYGIEPMRRHENNYLIREEWLTEWIPELFTIEAVEKMGLYYLISRIVHPLLVQPEEPTYAAKINDIAVRMTLDMEPDHAAQYSVNGLYVLTKK